MEIVAVVIVLALLEFVVFGMLVGRARGRYGVSAPAVSGHGAKTSNTDSALVDSSR